MSDIAAFLRMFVASWRYCRGQFERPWRTRREALRIALHDAREHVAHRREARS